MENKNLSKLFESYKQGFLMILVSLFFQFTITFLLISNAEELFLQNENISQSKLRDFNDYYIPLSKFISFICLSVLLYGLFILYSSTSKFLSKEIKRD